MSFTLELFSQSRGSGGWNETCLTIAFLTCCCCFGGNTSLFNLQNKNKSYINIIQIQSSLGRMIFLISLLPLALYTPFIIYTDSKPDQAHSKTQSKGEKHPFQEKYSCSVIFLKWLGSKVWG